MPLSGIYQPGSSSWARNQAELFERTGGAEGNEMQGRPIIVLTTVGARSGKLRKTALMRVEHDGAYAIVASKGGTPENPAWYHNVLAEPHVELQDRDGKHDYTAREVHGAERDAWWARALETWPPYADYQARTDRVIPVFVLERRD
ncbi:nitroreductase family deazaflavin-dependent oxidoreductase [Microbacterium gorillae]|uniref:nitroreductase family deazaflavin-dependent oxidoreductase n=1 Tax=Microbacterium gorillae TaxID=1231063 RepID=UPI00058B7827|nr:nitroreductase family deazaflavin-dependent oxidoreductase [Microbacterium gorillae]